jgi:hypothetical protein
MGPTSRNMQYVAMLQPHSKGPCGQTIAETAAARGRARMGATAACTKIVEVLVHGAAHYQVHDGKCARISRVLNCCELLSGWVMHYEFMTG